MFARSVSIRLRPAVSIRFAEAVEKEVMPRLRKQKGFRDVVVLLTPNGREAVAISMWDLKENAEAYGHTAYPEVLRALGDVVEGVPHVRSYEVCHSTFHSAVATAAG